jgi:hypothetical protein
VLKDFVRFCQAYLRKIIFKANEQSIPKQLDILVCLDHSS